MTKPVTAANSECASQSMPRSPPTMLMTDSPSRMMPNSPTRSTRCSRWTGRPFARRAMIATDGHHLAGDAAEKEDRAQRTVEEQRRRRKRGRAEERIVLRHGDRA